MGKEQNGQGHGFLGRLSGFRSQLYTLASSVTVDKSLNLSVFWLLHLYNGDDDNNSTYLKEL